jgi:hypothetical protein
MPAQLDHGGQLTAFLEHLTDGFSRRFVNGEHRASMSGRATPGKENQRIARTLFVSGRTHDCGGEDVTSLAWSKFLMCSGSSDSIPP